MFSSVCNNNPPPSPPQERLLHLLNKEHIQFYRLPTNVCISFDWTYHTQFEILHPFSAQNVGDTPGQRGGVLPEVVKQQERLLADPHFLDVVRNSDEHQAHTAAGRHLVLLAAS